MKEIGGYLDFEHYQGKEYYDYLTFNSSRNCLQYLIRKRNIKKIFLPYYLCLVVEQTCLNEKIEIIYYHINEKFLPIINNYKYNGETYVYIVNYFGVLNTKMIENMKNEYINVIIDNTHNFFQKGIENVDMIYNCRKYFGVPDGAYLSTNLKYNENYDLASSLERINYLFGRFEQSASAFYAKFIEADKTFDNKDIELMSSITHNLLKIIDYDNVLKIREENFNYLNKELKSINNLNINYVGNYMYPLLIENGEEVRKILIDNKIYIPKLWPNLDKFDLNKFEKKIFLNLLPIPIDQRYNINDMKIIIEKIQEQYDVFKRSRKK